MKADNQHLQLRGIALWLAVAYYETKESAYGDMQQLHRHLMRTLRLLKESMPANPAAPLWTTSRTAKPPPEKVFQRQLCAGFPGVFFV